MMVTLATSRVKGRLPTETSSSNVCVMTLQQTFQQPCTTCIENETERNSCSALIPLRYKISF